MSTILDVFDVETEVENATEYVFKNLSTYAPSIYTILDPKTFQKERPRVEVLCRRGAGTDKHLVHTEITGLELEIEDCWDLEINAAVITDADITSLRQFSAVVRYIMARLPALINTGTAPGLVNHFLAHPIFSEGDSLIYKPEDGVYQTHMTFKTIVSIHQNAWNGFIKV